MSTAAWTVTGATLRQPLAPAASSVSVAATVGTWGSVSRTVHVADRTQPTLLVVRENANIGWRATLNGHALATVTVDGWQQGYIMPAGAAGTVRLTFTPDRTYRAALLVGLLAVFVLIGACFSPVRRRYRLEPARAWTGTAVLGALALFVIAGGVGVIVWLGVGVVALALRGRARRKGDARPAVLAVLAGGAYLVAGSVLAVHHWNSANYAAPDALLQVLCLIALAATSLAGLVQRPLSVRAGRSEQLPAPVPSAPGAPPRGAAATSPEPR